MTVQTFRHDLRFGMVAVRNNFITVDQLVEAITIQVKEDVEGKPHRPIGKILTEIGHMTPFQTHEVLKDLAESCS